MAQGATQRILVVNDDRSLAVSVQTLLNQEGYEVAVAFDGNEALQVLAQWPADLVLLDLIMPRLDGYGFLEELSGRTATPRPVVLVWSVLDSHALARARRLGAAECLPRQTTTPDVLLQAITRLLEDRRTGQE